MNQDQVSREWEQIKGRARQVWGCLTDEDFASAQGSVAKLYEIIGEKFGDTEESIYAKLYPQNMKTIQPRIPTAAEIQKTQKMVPIIPTMGTTRDEVQMSVGRLEAQLMQWGVELDEISAQADASARADYRKNLDVLKVKYSAAQAKLAELKAASNEKWIDFKAGIESAWIELEVALKKLTN